MGAASPFLKGSCLAFQPGGLAEISRWRKPPVTPHKVSEPWKGDGIGASSPTPFQGLELTFATHRWLAPPANFHGASGAQPTHAVTTLNKYAPLALRSLQPPPSPFRCVSKLRSRLTNDTINPGNPR